MNRKDLAIARKFKHLIQQRVTPLDIKVFGSRARGNARADSDLDLFILVEHSSRAIEKYVSDCALEAGFEKNVHVVPVVVGKDRIDGLLKDSVFIHNVYREGITV